MKLYDGGRAPNPRRVRIFLAEKGIKVEKVPVNIRRHEMRADEIAALNPYQRMPVLQLEDGTAISESIAICRYFEELQPAPALFGETALEKAIVEMWNRRAELTLFNFVTSAFRHSHAAMASLEVPQFPQWGAANKAKARSAMRLLERQLAHHAYLCGAYYTVADITAQCALDFCKPAGIEVPDEFTNLQDWWRRVGSRPSAAA